MADLKNLSVEEFAAVTGSDAPAPGGGSVAALAGGLGAALAEMVANLTIGKAKYADVEEEMKGLAAEGAALRKELIDSIQKDTESFTAYMNALGMPKNTDEEKAARKEAMQNGLKEAAEVPLAVAETALKIFHVAGAVVERGNANAVTDGLVASMMARTAVLAIMEATRPSVTALAFPRSTTAPATWKILRAVSATARGTSAASFKPFCMASFLAAFSSSVFFGIPRAFIYAVKDSVSFWMESISSFLRAAPSAARPFISSSTSAYFAFPMVRFATISAKAAPRPPAKAATLPPPGAGASEPVTAANSSTDKFFKSATVYSSSKRRFSMIWDGSKPATWR